jgi:hypothetical protein
MAGGVSTSTILYRTLTYILFHFVFSKILLRFRVSTTHFKVFTGHPLPLVNTTRSLDRSNDPTCQDSCVVLVLLHGYRSAPQPLCSLHALLQPLYLHGSRVCAVFSIRQNHPQPSFSHAPIWWCLCSLDVSPAHYVARNQRYAGLDALSDCAFFHRHRGAV